ncbi:MAG: translation initiation factor IF-2 [Eubacteriales bacterium]|nr:translation initiation factor IF-2 [Eubacteriales bacterium]
MEKVRVHELARKLGIENREVLEFLKTRGIELRSHMSSLSAEQIAMLEGKFGRAGKEHLEKLDTTRTEEKAKMSKPEENKMEAGNKEGGQTPKKKKNIIRIFRAQNASDGGKSHQQKKDRKQAEKKAAVKPVKSEETVQEKPSAPAAPKQDKAPVQQMPRREKAPAELKPEGKAAEAAKLAPEKTAEPKQERKPENRPAPQRKEERQQGSRDGGNSRSRDNAGKGESRSFRGEGRGENRQEGRQAGKFQGNRENREGRDNRDGREGREGGRDSREGRFSRNAQGNRGQSQGSRPQRQGEGRSEGRGDARSEGRQGFSSGQGGRGQNQGSRPQRPQGSRMAGSGEGRGDARGEGRGENRGDNRQGSRGQGGKGQGTRRNDSNDVFVPEMTKTSKDSKRERDRENKNKKKDYENNQGQGRRPNQGGKFQQSRLPKALQKPTSAQKPEPQKPEVKEIVLPEKLTIRELADKMKMQPSVIVKKLFLQGIMVTVNHEIDFEKAQEIALEYDIIAEQEEKVDIIEELLREDEEREEDMVARPPVVCVMGHVDHGKTSLLDAIRNTNVTRGEAGGITQHIGAYVVTINDQKITFLDTPGHEAFTAMRMRGANATDIAVLVVAADDGVMPQTVEAISHAKAAGVEIIVAINKIDKPSANVERVKQELSEYELIPEDWGGSTVFVPVSARTGEGIDTLLEMILLTAEVAELKANPDRAARGLVIEAQLDKGKGPVATILVQKGTLHVGDFIAAGSCSGKVRAMMDDKGRRVKEAAPSTPVEILGLGDVPNAGEVLMSFDSDKEAKNFAGAFVSENKNRLLEETKGKLSLDNLFDQIQASDLKELPIVVKADVQGSVEAVKQSLTKLSNEEVVVKVIHGGVGAINESDVSLAATSNAIVIGFNVRPDTTAKQLAEQEGVDLRLYRVIYQAIEDIEAAMKGMLDPIYEEKVIGHAEVRQLFKASGVGTIAGSYVLDGVFQRNCKIRISREGEQIFEGELASLKRFKDDVKEVKAGYECGLVFKDFNDVKEEDQVEAYIMVEVPR